MDLTKQLQDYQKAFGDTHSELVQEIVALVSKFEVTLDREKLNQEENKKRLKESFKVCSRRSNSHLIEL